MKASMDAAYNVDVKIPTLPPKADFSAEQVRRGCWRRAAGAAAGWRWLARLALWLRALLALLRLRLAAAGGGWRRLAAAGGWRCGCWRCGCWRCGCWRCGCWR
jgi:hypothetical protein